MNNTQFDIQDYLKQNKIEITPENKVKGKNTFKGYNDVRKTLLSEAKIKDGKFSINESLKGVKENRRPFSTELKKHFLEIISTYNTYQEQMKRQSDIIEIADTLGGIVEAAKELTLNEADDWFDKVTIKRNMKQLEQLETNFGKVSSEAKMLDSRMQALYEEMGLILNRYYEISDIDPQVMRERLGKTDESRDKTPKHTLMVTNTQTDETHEVAKFYAAGDLFNAITAFQKASPKHLKYFKGK
jgi:hypothetical protein